jgi:hypothetical protein
MRKVRIPMALLEESHNPKRVEEDRSIAIEAAIVRIMKVREAALMFLFPLTGVHYARVAILYRDCARNYQSWACLSCVRFFLT